jgi:hypothetical protein
MEIISENPTMIRTLNSLLSSATQLINSKDYDGAMFVIVAGQGALYKLEEEGLFMDHDTFEDYWDKFRGLRMNVMEWKRWKS